MTIAFKGESVKRSEDHRLITGEGTYVDDVRLLGLLHVAFVRSPHAHALIRGIDVSAAAAANKRVSGFSPAPNCRNNSVHFLSDGYSQIRTRPHTHHWLSRRSGT